MFYKTEETASTPATAGKGSDESSEASPKSNTAALDGTLKVFVGGLSYETTEDQLRKDFLKK